MTTTLSLTEAKEAKKQNIKELQKLAEEAGYNLVKTPTLPILKEKVGNELLNHILSSSTYYKEYSHSLLTENAPIFKYALEENIDRLYNNLTYYESCLNQYKNSQLTEEEYNKRKESIIKYIQENIFNGAYTYNIPLKILSEPFILYLSNVTGIKPITLYNFSIHTEIISDITSPLYNIPYTLKYINEIKERKEEFINSIFSNTPKTREKFLKQDIITKNSINFLNEIFSLSKTIINTDTNTDSRDFISDFCNENYLYAYSFIYSMEEKEKYFHKTSYINYFYLSPTQTPIPRIKGLEYNIREYKSRYSTQKYSSYTITLEELRNYNTYSPILRKCETIHRQTQCAIKKEIEEKYLQEQKQEEN